MIATEAVSRCLLLLVVYQKVLSICKIKKMYIHAEILQGNSTVDILMYKNVFNI
jgi:hypothetical protein